MLCLGILTDIWQESITDTLNILTILQLFFFITIQIIQAEKKHLKAWCGDQDQTKHLVLMTEPMGKPYMLGSGVSSHDQE